MGAIYGVIIPVVVGDLSFARSVMVSVMGNQRNRHGVPPKVYAVVTIATNE